MLVKDQLKAQMALKGVSVTELAQMLGVSNQTVRHWLTGRSFPGKRKTPELERVLSFKLDYSEGASGQPPREGEFVALADIELVLTINKLPQPFKQMFLEMAREIISRLPEESAK